MNTRTIVLCTKCGMIKMIDRDLYQISWHELSVFEKSALDTIKSSRTLKSIFGTFEVKYEYCIHCENNPKNSSP